MGRSKENIPSDTIQFFGAAGGVTGSCYRVDHRGSGLCVVDCGLFQGKLEERSAKGERWNFDPAGPIFHGVPHVLLSHVHIDHSGRLPKVYRDGLEPTILSTATTADLLPIMLYDSAKIQEMEDPNRRKVRDKLYVRRDVDKTLRHVQKVPPDEEVPIGPKHGRASAIFLPNGHVVGANTIFVYTGDQHNILFTGDIGKPEQSLCGGYLDQNLQYPNGPVHTLVVESTNINREPVRFEEKQHNFLKAITSAWEKGGNPLLPVLSFHRLQEIIEMLAHSQRNGLIPADCKIYVDAPLGVTILEAFERLPPDQLSKRYGDDPEYYKTDAQSHGRFILNNMTIVDSHDASVANDAVLADYSGKVIILASGGMGEHGRALNYLHGRFGQNVKNTVIFTCHQISSTEGEALVRAQNIPGSKSRIGAGVVKINGFTSHASGPEEVFGYLQRFDLSRLETVLITHGSDRARIAMANEFQARGISNVILPKMHQVVQI